MSDIFTPPCRCKSSTPCQCTQTALMSITKSSLALVPFTAAELNTRKVTANTATVRTELPTFTTLPFSLSPSQIFCEGPASR